MALGANRRRIVVKGLGNYEVREIDPSPATTYTSIGFVKEASLNDIATIEEEVNDAGHFIDAPTKERKVMGLAQLMQTSKGELDFVRNAGTKLYAVRFHGTPNNTLWQYFCFPVCRIAPTVQLPFKVGERLLPMAFGALKQASADYDIPEYYMNEGASEMYVTGLKLWASPRLGLNYAANKLLDTSGFEKHGTITSDYAASIWQADTSPAYFLRLDGVNDAVNHDTDVMDDDGVSDFMLEAWVRVKGADGTTQEILGKSADIGGGAEGFLLQRRTSNTLRFALSDGVQYPVDSVATVLVNVWTHVAVTVDRNGNMTIYVNGSASGTPASCAACASTSNARNFKLGGDDATFGQVDLGDVRGYQWTSLPSNIATVIANHYNAEKGYYGL